MQKSEKMNFKLTPAQRAKLEQLAAAAGLNVSTVITELIEQADVAIDAADIHVIAGQGKTTCVEKNCRLWATSGGYNGTGHQTLISFAIT